MKRLVFISLIFISGFAFSQEASQKDIKDWRKPSPAAFNINYKTDTVVNRYKSLSPVDVFKYSSTIFDMKKIFLFKNGTFFCYTRNCLQEGSSAGNYIRNNDTLILTSSNKVFNKLKINSPLKENSFVFVELQDLKFIVKKEELISVK